MQAERSRLERRRTRLSQSVAVGVTIGLAAAGFLALHIRANLQPIFDDLGYVELPSLTRCVLALPWCVILCVFLVPGVWMLVKDGVIRDVRVRQWGDLVVGLAFFGWILLLVIGLFLPLVVLIERID
jgi:hypothetical protein